MPTCKSKDRGNNTAYEPPLVKIIKKRFLSTHFWISPALATHPFSSFPKDYRYLMNDPHNTNHDEVDGNDKIQESRHDENQDPGD